MKELLAMLCTIDWLANDLHYRSNGPGFYEKHLLADRVKGFGDAEDKLKEAYWLGFRKCVPPYDTEIAQAAMFTYDQVCKGCNGELQRLVVAFDALKQIVEAAKLEEGLPAGIHAILDGISEKALTYGFLVRSEIGIASAPCATA